MAKATGSLRRKTTPRLDQRLLRDPVFRLETIKQLTGAKDWCAEYRFDPARRWRADFASESLGYILEIEGGVWLNGRHLQPGGFLKDMEKYNQMAAKGWLLFRCTPSTFLEVVQLMADSKKVVKRVFCGRKAT